MIRAQNSVDEARPAMGDDAAGAGDDEPRDRIERPRSRRLWRLLGTAYEVYRGSIANAERTRRAVRASDAPIVVGPWLSEVGFELLYWIPYLEHAFRADGIDPKRVVALSRGGVAGWYSGIAERYVDLFELMSTEEYLETSARRERLEGVKKQMTIFDFERDLATRAARRLNIDDYTLFHPSTMYRLFAGYWRGRRHLRFVQRELDHRPFAADWPRPELPFDGDYVALKFYHSDCFPATEANRRFIEALILELAEDFDVVLLNTPIALDDHADAKAIEHSRVFDASPLMTTVDNLAVQSAIVANAAALHATYGGFSYLGHYLRVPTFAYYGGTDNLGSHLGLALEAFAPQTSPPFAVLSTNSAQHLTMTKSHRFSMKEGVR